MTGHTLVARCEEDMENTHTDDEIRALIRQAFDQPDPFTPQTPGEIVLPDEPRTSFGIAAQTSLPLETVEDYVSRHPSEFEQLSVGLGGRRVFRLAGIKTILHLSKDEFREFAHTVHRDTVDIEESWPRYVMAVRRTMDHHFPDIRSAVIPIENGKTTLTVMPASDSIAHEILSVTGAVLNNASEWKVARQYQPAR